MPINNGDLLVLGDIGHSADVEIHEVGGSVVDQLGHPSAVGSYGAGQDAAYRGRQIGGRGVATEGHICFVVSVQDLVGGVVRLGGRLGVGEIKTGVGIHISDIDSGIRELVHVVGGCGRGSPFGDDQLGVVVGQSHI